MEVCDYGKSFLTFVVEDRANNARIQLEARCRLFSDDSDNPVPSKQPTDDREMSRPLDHGAILP